MSDNLPISSDSETPPSLNSSSTEGEHAAIRLIEGEEPETGISSSALLSTATLCGRCREFNFSRETLDHRYRPGGLDLNATFNTWGQLLSTAETCPLCKVILKGFETTWATGRNGYDYKVSLEDASEVFVSIWPWDEEKWKETRISFFVVSRNEKTTGHPINRLTECDLRVYQDKGDDEAEVRWEGSESPNLDWARTPPFAPWSAASLRQLNTWIDECVNGHGDTCSLMTLSGVKVDESLPPILPTRVIDVGTGPLDGPLSPRLVETNGARGHYTALSYCWGSSAKSGRPYLTTSKTLQDHLSSIPWEILPRTLQDAVRLTRGIGLRYVWIDSMCIIQDSADDWKKEAAKMGDVYAQARLVIAATRGTDANAGLFPPPFSLSEEYVHRPGQRSLYFCKAQRTLKDEWNEKAPTPYDLALFTRGWTAQEWILARRIVFWTEERMNWRCQCRCVADDGEDIDHNAGTFRGNLSWLEIARLYSHRSFTYLSDKLAALQGMASEMQKSRPGDKYAAGSWLSNMPYELLWSGQVELTSSEPPPDLKELNIPSWSWASHPGGVHFIHDSQNPAEPERYQFQTIDKLSCSILDNSSLKIVARSKGFNIHASHTSACFVQRRKFNVCKAGFGLQEHFLCGLFFSDDFGPLQVQFTSMTLSELWLKPNEPYTMRAFREKKDPQRMDILIVFDTIEYRRPIEWKQFHGCADVPDRWSRDYVFVELMRWKGRPDDLKTWKEKYPEYGESAWVTGAAGLMLRKSPRTSGADKYIRVGMALALDSWLTDLKDMSEFVIE